jgi:hypothetical protein
MENAKYTIRPDEYLVYGEYQILNSPRCVSDILHALITPYSSGRVVYLTFSIHYLLITHQGDAQLSLMSN